MSEDTGNFVSEAEQEADSEIFSELSDMKEYTPWVCIKKIPKALISSIIRGWGGGGGGGGVCVCVLVF